MRNTALDLEMAWLPAKCQASNQQPAACLEEEVGQARQHILRRELPAVCCRRLQARTIVQHLLPAKARRGQRYDDVSRAILAGWLGRQMR